MLKMPSSLGFLRGSVTSSGHAWPASSLVSGQGCWDCWAHRCRLSCPFSGSIELLDAFLIENIRWCWKKNEKQYVLLRILPLENTRSLVGSASRIWLNWSKASGWRVPPDWCQSALSRPASVSDFDITSPPCVSHFRHVQIFVHLYRGNPALSNRKLDHTPPFIQRC